MTEPIRTNKIGLEIKKRLESIDSQQAQINALVVNGDSSPQAAQASVGADNTDYGGNLKARLDAEYNKTNQKIDDNQADTAAQLADTQNSIGVSISQFPRLEVETDDTGRLARAAQFVEQAGGGKVVLPPGEFITQYYKMRYHVLLVGMLMATILKLKDGSLYDLVSLNDANVERAGLICIALDGNKSGGTTGNAIFLDAPGFTNPTNPDDSLVFEKVFIKDAAANGIRTGQNIREARFSGIFIQTCEGDGLYAYGTDCDFSHITSFWNKGSGFRFLGTNDRAIDLKSFGNKTYGYWLNGAKRFHGSILQAQENYNHGFLIGNCDDITIDGILADANGYSDSGIPTQPSNLNGVHAYNTTKLRITGAAEDFHKASGGSGYQCYGISLSACDDYDIQMKVNNNYQPFFFADNNGKGIFRVNDTEIRKNMNHVINRDDGQDNFLKLERNGKVRVLIGESISGNYATIDAYDSNGIFLGSLGRINLSDGSAMLGLSGKNLGFYGSSGVSKPEVIGSKSDGSAISSLLNALNGQGLITDHTT
jgi:hypothetical protein